MDALPDRIYLSIDLDVLQPGSGHFIPGGLTFAEVIFLLDQLQERGLELVGADLVGSSSTEGSLSGHLGAHLLYHICNLFREQGQLY
mgnify:CR=1 FL=1